MWRLTPPKAGLWARISKATLNSFSRSQGGPGAALPPVTVTLDYDKCVPATASIAPGKVVFEIRNAGKLPAVFGILQLPIATFQRPKLHFAPSLSGKRLLMTQTFRDFFRSEVISATEGIAVLDVTLVFTDLKRSTALYERIGDLTPTFRCSGTSSICSTPPSGTMAPSPRRSVTR
jgi:hypothetical protein